MPGESQGRGSLVDYHLWGRTESDTTERLHFHFSFSCIGEGNGNPLLPGESQGRGSLLGCCLWGRTEWDTTEATWRQQQPLRLDNFNCLIDPFFFPAQVSYGTNSPSRMKGKLRYFPGGTSGKEPACQCRQCKRSRFSLWVRKISWRRKWQPTPVFSLGESQWQGNLAGYGP